MEKALSILSDYFDRAMCPFMLLGETGHAVFYEEGLSGTAIEIGVKSTSMTEYAYSTLKNLIDNFGTASVPTTFSLGTIPVRFFTLQKDCDVFRHPDQKWYGNDIYLVPNPFVKYYKNRNFWE